MYGACSCIWGDRCRGAAFRLLCNWQSRSLTAVNRCTVHSAHVCVCVSVNGVTLQVVEVLVCVCLALQT